MLCVLAAVQAAGSSAPDKARARRLLFLQALQQGFFLNLPLVMLDMAHVNPYIDCPVYPVSECIS